MANEEIIIGKLIMHIGIQRQNETFFRTNFLLFILLRQRLNASFKKDHLSVYSFKDKDRSISFFQERMNRNGFFF